MFSALPFSDAKFELAISVLQPLNFHLAMPNYGVNASKQLCGSEFGTLVRRTLPALLSALLDSIIY